MRILCVGFYTPTGGNRKKTLPAYRLSIRWNKGSQSEHYKRYTTRKNVSEIGSAFYFGRNVTSDQIVSSKCM